MKKQHREDAVGFIDPFEFEQGSIEDMLKNVKLQFSKIVAKINAKEDKYKGFRLEVLGEYEDTCIQVHALRLETDKEFEFRKKREAKRKQLEKEREEKKEAKERAELKRLLKKYGKEEMV